MDQNGSSHDAQENRLPEPSIWAVIAGLAAIVLGSAIIWWAKDAESDFAGPFLGAALVATLVSVAGWAFEDSQSRRRAATAGSREPRFTQVVAFAIAEGRLDATRQPGGVLHALLDAASGLRDLPGFEDLRLVVSPATKGTAQAIAETTWSARDRFDGYDATRRTVLDVLNAHGADVVPGSVQAFDMEVVRDTKEVAFRFGAFAASTVFLSLIAGGLMIGAGLALVEEDEEAAVVPAEGASGGGGAAPAAAGPIAIAGTDNKFDKTAIKGSAGKELEVKFSNEGKVPHNVHFYDKKGGVTLAPGAEGKILVAGQSETLKFTVATAGKYYYQCDVHPTEMIGELTVE